MASTTKAEEELCLPVAAAAGTAGSYLYPSDPFFPCIVLIVGIWTHDMMKLQLVHNYDLSPPCVLLGQRPTYYCKKHLLLLAPSRRSSVFTQLGLTGINNQVRS